MVARMDNPNLRQASQLVYDYPSAKSFLRGSSDRKLAHNTWVLDRSHTASTMRHGHAIAVRYHNTDIVTYFEDGTIIVNNGGYMTVTTNKRLNLFLPPGFRVMQKNYQMYLLAPHDRKLPFDGYVEFNADNLRQAGKVVQVDHRREIMDVADSIGLEPFVPRRGRKVDLGQDYYPCCHAPKDMGHMMGCPNSDFRREKNPRRGPGKFDTDLDAVLYQLSLDGNEGEYGDVDEYGVHVCLLLSITLAELSRATKDSGEDYDDVVEDIQDAKMLVPFSAIITTDSSGFVTVELFQDANDARITFEKGESDYEEFLFGLSED